MMRSDRIVVIGFGNPMRGDDAAGLEVARRMRQGGYPKINTTELVSDAAALADAWGECETAIVLDAMNTGLRPGSVRSFSAEQVMAGAAGAFASTHGLGLVEALRLAQTLDRLPKRLVVIGIEGSRFDLGEKMTHEVERAIESAAALVLHEAGLASAAEAASPANDNAAPARK